MKHLHDSILNTAAQTGVDSRLILATVMQESKGCVRVPTTNNGFANPGLMQTFEGTASCNSGTLAGGVLTPGEVQTPCPAKVIQKMVEEGTEGISAKAMSLKYA